ncbi:helix-turn-helix domain-containing protein [Rhodopseudomonas sp. P2A-2r]|uniref:helix-turn-helix domain-containing protein n=1 Tax=Rhodopseudomonas sp. P2A-2r TaxID=2991972 RepID=UPI0022345FD6|nr:helix-turn-helix domain-containing protein [Rhodopseudomonas sp. P2A-2r]UZE47931.1 helix-turn-helix domain-containing protein [Rhodopseudomonas sp. P2A-2r]
MTDQLDIIDDTDLAKDPRWIAPSASSSVVSPSASSSLKQIRRIVAAPSASSSVDPRIVVINRRREAAGMAHDQFARLANVSVWTWRDLRRGARAPMPSTLAKLNAALDASRPPKPAQVVASYHRLLMQHLARHLNFDVPTLLATDFSVQRPFNAQWLAAARIRQMAIYLTAVELQVGNAELGRALGLTRANIKYARDEVEQRREDGNEVDEALTIVLQQVKA